MLRVLLAALLCAGAVFFAAYGLGSWALQSLYMSPESRAARQAEIYSELFRYVKDNQITGDDAEAVARWTREHPYVAVQVYADEELNNRSSFRQGQSAAVTRPQSLPTSSRLYPMRFADGLYRVAISDTSDVREDNINRAIAMLLGSLAFITILFTYIRRLTARILRLSREADAIGAGELEAPITMQGEDELAGLAREIDAMRRSVIARMSGERRAWEANSELITAISHDIRTPMTALIGYLGLLNEQLPEEAERERQFAASAYDKAMELKDLTDELFRYFLVFGRAELDMHPETLDARLLLEQLLGEAAFELQDAGFAVEQTDFEGECQLRLDPLYLKRVVDNLVSNIKKYAERTKPVLIVCERREGHLSVCFSNAVAASAARVESTKIGLRTCEKIMQALGGAFTVTNDGEHFAADFILPEE